MSRGDVIFWAVVATVVTGLLFLMVWDVEETRKARERCLERGGYFYKPHKSEGVCLSQEMLK